MKEDLGMASVFDLSNWKNRVPFSEIGMLRCGGVVGEVSRLCFMDVNILKMSKSRCQIGSCVCFWRWGEKSRLQVRVSGYSHIQMRKRDQNWGSSRGHRYFVKDLRPEFNELFSV